MGVGGGIVDVDVDVIDGGCVDGGGCVGIDVDVDVIGGGCVGNG